MSRRPIFLLSLPRSGSTLLQRILASHSEIATAPEPWILLPQIYAMREKGAFAEYGQVPSSRAVREFAQGLPRGEDDYFDELRAFVLGLYGKATPGQETYFLDKTPRYYFVVEDLFRLFPDGKFIFLWRDPLAIVASIVDTWGRGRWNLERWRRDLFEGVPRLVAAHERFAGSSIAVRYEDLIADAPATLGPVFDYLEIPNEGGVLSSFTDLRLAGRMGDKKGTGEYAALSTEPLDKWKDVLSTSVRKRWCARYLEALGAERLDVMGYDLGSLLKELDAVPTNLRKVGSDLLWVPASKLARARREVAARVAFR